MEQPGNKRAGDDKKQQAAGSVELHRAANGVPDMLGGRSVKDGDGAEFAAAGLAGIDDARAVLTKQAVLPSVQLEMRDAVALRNYVAAAALPVG